MGCKIQVDCICGKILKIPDKYAGKKGRCPHCGKKIAIPSVREIRNSAKKDQEKELPSCPTCGAYLKAGAKMCISCHTDLSTGEWNIEGLKARTPKHNPWYSVAIVLAIAIVFAGILFLLFPKTPKSLAPLRANPVATATTLGTSIEKIMAMPETNLSSLEEKLKNFEDFLDKQLRIPVMASFNSLLQREREMQAENAHKLLPAEQSPLKRWQMLKQIRNQFEDTRYVQKIVVKEMQDLQKQGIEIIREQKNAMQDFFNSQEYDKGFATAIDLFGNMLQYAYPDKKFQEKHQAYIRLCNEAAASFQSGSTTEEINEEDLANVVKKINAFLPKYYKLIAKWNFPEVFLKITPLATEARLVKEKFPDDANLRKILQLNDEVKLLEQFWHFAIQGAKSLVGKTEVLYLHNKKVITGKIEKFAKEKFHIATESSVQVISMADLAPQSLGKLASLNQSSQWHLPAAAFYYINNEEHLCRDACKEALQNGVTMKAIEKYHKWSKGLVDEQSKALADRQKAEQRRRELEAAERAKNRQERNLKKAWYLIRSIIKNYNNKADLNVLGLLQELKELIPREELIKINQELKNKDGHDLIDICKSVFLYCRTCRNSETGKLKCPVCLGDGYTSVGTPGYDTHPYRKKPCTNCNMFGEVYCPGCHKKRSNRNYILLKSFYESFSGMAAGFEETTEEATTEAE